MSEEPKGATPPERDVPDLKEELREMGQQLEQAFRAVVTSERTKQLQRDLSAGVREITSQLKTAAENLQTDPRVKQAEERGREAIGDLRESKLAQDMQEAVVLGIQTLNAQLRKLVERIEQETRAAGTSTPTERVPIDHEPPATGQTTKLDE